MRLQNKVAVVTGAASGIGRATVETFVREGAKVVIADIQDELGEDLATEFGSNAIYLHTDVSDESQVKNMIDTAVQHFGGLHCLFNNAGYGGVGGEIHETDMQDAFQSSLDVLFKGVVLGMKYAAPVMREQQSGSIINTASVAGLSAGFGPHVYTGLKAAVVNISRSVAVELGPFSIRVNAICPGGIATNIIADGFKRLLGGELPEGANQKISDKLKPVLAQLQPIPRSGLPEDIANMALFLASEESTFVSGQAMVVDGGLTAGRMRSESLVEQIMPVFTEE